MVLRSLVGGLIGMLSFGMLAHAADMPEWSPPELGPRAPTPGWYLRGDVGYRFNMIGTVSGAPGFPVPDDNRLNDAFSGGVGAGFKWEHIRVDLTADYGARSTYTGTGNAASVAARIQAITALANAYYDIGTWWGITPYLGAGAGFARVSLSDYQSATTPPFTGVDASTSYNPAWAVMAGASYQAMPNLSLDVGYRFLDQGTVSTESNAFGSFTLGRIRSHEVRLGLRWFYQSGSSSFR